MYDDLRYHTIGMRLHGFREAAGLSQFELARRVGISQGTLSRWERDLEPVPESRLEALAAVLDVPVSLLAEVSMPAPHGRRPLPDLVRRCHKKPLELPPYDVTGRIDDVLAINDAARRTFSLARKRLSAGQLAHVEQYFPRDSASELLVVFHVIAMSGRLERMTLADLRCPQLVVKARNSFSSGLYHQRDVLVLERPQSVLILTPQPWVVSPTQSEWYRLDFLTCVISHDGRERWFDVEIDDFSHELDRGKDQRRARGVGVPRIGFPNYQVAHPDFGERLAARLEATPHQPQPSFTYVDSEGNTTGDPYDPWFRRSARKPQARGDESPPGKQGRRTTDQDSGVSGSRPGRQG